MKIKESGHWILQAIYLIDQGLLEEVKVLEKSTSHLGWRREQIIPYKSVENPP